MSNFFGCLGLMFLWYVLGLIWIGIGHLILGFLEGITGIQDEWLDLVLWLVAYGWPVWIALVIRVIKRG